MSHLVVFNPGGGVAPVTEIETLTGNNGLPVGPTGNNIDIVSPESTGLEVDGTPGTSTLEINNRQHLLTTNDAVATAVFTLPIGALSAYQISIEIVGTRADYSASFWTSGSFGVRRAAAGAPVVVGISDLVANTDGAIGMDVDAVIVGNTIEVQMTGEAATVWNWIAQVSWILI